MLINSEFPTIPLVVWPRMVSADGEKQEDKRSMEETRRTRSGGGVTGRGWSSLPS